MLLVTVFTMPLCFAFPPIDRALLPTNVTIGQSCSGLDIVKNFFTGYHDEDGFLVLAHRKVVRRYVTGWLLPDFFSIFPVEFVLLLFDSAEGREFSDSTRVIKMAKLARLAKLVRLLRASALFKKIQGAKPPPDTRRI